MESSDNKVKDIESISLDIARAMEDYKLIRWKDIPLAQMIVRSFLNGKSWVTNTKSTSEEDGVNYFP